MKSVDNTQRRRIIWLAGVGAAALGAAAVWRASNTLSYPKGSQMAVDLTELPEGKLLTLAWQGKPVWVLRRSYAEIATLTGQEARLTDPHSLESVQPESCCNSHRSISADIFVAIGLCTHQGCTPVLQASVGFICPCHASRYDLAGRVFKAGPAPANLVIPAYSFESKNRLLLGVEA
jgi:ubiquinol-cytochrome c reductase iron-sulfur subunit